MIGYQGVAGPMGRNSDGSEFHGKVPRKNTNYFRGSRVRGENFMLIPRKIQSLEDVRKIMKEFSDISELLKMIGQITRPVSFSSQSLRFDNCFTIALGYPYILQLLFANEKVSLRLYGTAFLDLERDFVYLGHFDLPVKSEQVSSFTDDFLAIIKLDEQLRKSVQHFENNIANP